MCESDQADQKWYLLKEIHPGKQSPFRNRMLLKTTTIEEEISHSHNPGSFRGSCGTRGRHEALKSVINSIQRVISSSQNTTILNLLAI
jgi:hypothetical protein